MSSEEEDTSDEEEQEEVKELGDAKLWSYADGDLSQQYLSFKIGCDNDLVFMARRLEYERRGTNGECLRRGYGNGTLHLKLRPTDEDEDKLDADYKTTTTIRPIRQFPFRSQNTSTPVNVEEMPEENDFSGLAPGMFDFATNQFTPSFLEHLERIPAGNLPNTRFIGLRTQNFKREYRFLDHSFDIGRIQNSLSYADKRKILSMQIANGVCLFALPVLGAHMEELFPNQFPFILCEVNYGLDASNKHTVTFVSVGPVYLQSYVNIFYQQFVPPRSDSWRFYHMSVANVDQLLFVLCRRLDGRDVNLRNVRQIQAAYIRRYILHIARGAPPLGGTSSGSSSSSSSSSSSPSSSSSGSSLLPLPVPQPVSVPGPLQVTPSSGSSIYFPSSAPTAPV